MKLALLLYSKRGRPLTQTRKGGVRVTLAPLLPVSPRLWRSHETPSLRTVALSNTKQRAQRAKISIILIRSRTVRMFASRPVRLESCHRVWTDEGMRLGFRLYRNSRTPASGRRDCRRQEGRRQVMFLAVACPRVVLERLITAKRGSNYAKLE
jgi:hypothetical protein